MATLRHPPTGREHPVAARLLVGRAPSCALRLDDPHVSGEHATLIWTGARWEVRDLGSRNGTFVDGQRVGPGEVVALAAGATVGFGHVDDPWVLLDAEPPGAFAEHTGSGRLRRARSGLLALPDDISPELVAYPDRNGRWILESADGEVRPVVDGEIVTAGGAPWRLRVPDAQIGTAAVDTGPHIDTITLRFAVSRDEEHVEITVLHRGQATPLEAREHGYTLLTLARARLEDADLPPSEQGWIDRDRLLKMLGTDSNGLNVAIYRARGQLSKAGVEGAAGLVEVRRGARRLGLEVERLEVVAL